MILRKITFLAFYLVALGIQDTWLPAIAVLGVQPDLLLCAAVFIALWRKPRYALIMAVLLGLSRDLLLGRYIGLSALAFLAAVALIIRVGPRFYKENYLVPVAAVFLGGAISALTYALGGKLVGMPITLGPYLLTQAMPQAVYSALIAPFLYVPAYLIFVQWGTEKVMKNEE
ncbi:MAG: rod shape-determining protein MreD [Clostridiales bacterium]|jgi:rod shape-determining protein MreD|nr:rod shape-determining protein MreD [Clostridiales bacterium]MDR2713597.1 rod shape-determining protein MreD [Clostridiales bacterium]